MSDNQYATLRINGESARVRVTQGLTVREAFRQNAGSLGIDANANLQFRSGPSTVDGNSTLCAGADITASVSRETKGF